MRKVIIIGAGPAGLAAGYKLCANKISLVILEKDPVVGGLSRTIKYRGYLFDIGPHRFFTKNKSVFDWWREILKKDFVKTPRYTRIYYKGKFFNYPLSIKNIIANLGIFNLLPIFFSYLKSRLLPYPEEANFEQCITNRFGRRLYQAFFKHYTEKVWGIPCERISADWAGQRIKGLSFSAALRNALFKKNASALATLVSEFYFPRLGAGMMYEAAAGKIINSGGEIKPGSEVIEVRHDHKRITGLLCRETLSGRYFEIEGTDFCSSMPINHLISRMNPPPAEHILKMNKQLFYRSLVMVYLIVDKKDVFRDNWIYIHSHDVKAGRIQNYKNWSLAMVADPDKSSLGIEYFCTEGDFLWRQSDESAIKLAAEELEKLNIARAKDIIDAFVLRVANAYPVYEKDYRYALDQIKSFLSGFSNLQCIGRYGMFRYNNMDHSVLSGFLAAENILGAKANLWNINMEQSYQEELGAENPAQLE